MILKALTIAGSLGGAVAFSQLPEFSQQYMQRLAGAVDELSRISESFDDDAKALGMTRGDALGQMRAAGGMSERRAARIAETLDRHERLSADLSAMRQADPVGRALITLRSTDAEVARNAWRDFKPAVPVTASGALFAALGLLSGFGLVRGGAMVARRAPFRRRKTT